MKITQRLLPAFAALLCFGAAAGHHSVKAANNFGEIFSGIGLSDSVSDDSGDWELPPFTPFDLSADPCGYVIEGTIFSAAGESPGTMVIDTPNKRVAFLFGAVGTFITTPTDSWNFNIPNTGGVCFLYAGFGYDKLAASFTQITSAPGSTECDATYNGFTKDSFSCNQNVTFALRQERIGHPRVPVITEMFAALPSAAGPVCRQGQAYFIADKRTLDTESDRDHFFKLPPSCNTPIPFCAAAYPCGNACAIDCCPTASGEKTCN